MSEITSSTEKFVKDPDVFAAAASAGLELIQARDDLAAIVDQPPLAPEDRFRQVANILTLYDYDPAIVAALGRPDDSAVNA